MILGAEQQLVLEFDLLGSERISYFYSIELCNAGWDKANVAPSEYIDGYPEEEIASMELSFNTTPAYIHYELLFPTAVMKIKQSGNYILRVFPASSPENTAISLRFLVLDRKMEITGLADNAVQTEYRFYKQNISFVLRASDYEVADPYRELKVMVLKNDNWNDCADSLQPVFSKPGEWEYRDETKLNFWGGREYRSVDLKNLRQFNVSKIDKVVTGSDGVEDVFLHISQKRTFLKYTLEPDLDGISVMSCAPCKDPELESEYVRVHFFLNMDEQLKGKDVYVLGGFNHHNPSARSRLKWNSSLPGYVGNIQMKQGYYNYLFATVDHGTKIPDLFPLEGSRVETGNTYTVLVYHQPIGSYHDELIGYLRLPVHSSR